MFGALLSIVLQAGAPAATPAAAPAPTAAQPSVITAPDWISRPTGDDMARLYPRAAAIAEVEGRVTLACSVTAEGLLAECSVTSEDPADQGFGAAALGMVPKFRMRPLTKDGVPVAGGTVRIPVRFVLPTGEPGPAPAEIVKAAGQCYYAVVKRLEQAPGDSNAQAAYFATRMVIELTMLARKLPPAEIDAELVRLRTTAPPPETALERKVCEEMREAAGRSGFDRMIGRLPATP